MNNESLIRGVHCYHAPTATAVGTVQVAPAAARRLAHRLATCGTGAYDHAAPATVQGAIASAVVADMFDSFGGYNRSHSRTVLPGAYLGEDQHRPDVQAMPDGSVVWRPWSRSVHDYSGTRYLRIYPDGRIEWDAGKADSTFIAACLLQCAPLADLGGVVSLKRFEIRETERARLAAFRAAEEAGIPWLAA